MSEFNVGEIAIFVSFYKTNNRLNGTAVTIVGPPHKGLKGIEYPTEPKLNGFKYVYEVSLRKKKPPQEKLGDWEMIEIGTGWSPFKVTAPKEKQKKNV